MSFVEGASHLKFFTGEERGKIQALELREVPIVGIPMESCKTNLFFGFFFDGTKNNYVQAEKGLNHSNVARLYDCYPGRSVPGVLPVTADWQYKPSDFTHFFKTYIPGVASPFKEVNDSGENLELTRGAAMGYRGEARIIWALIQAINNVHRYFYKAPIVSASETAKLVGMLDLSVACRRAMRPDAISDPHNDAARALKRTRDEFEKILRRLHAAVSAHWPDKKTGRPGKIDPGIVKTIHVSIFGFSRGATQARAFANWLIESCGLNARFSGRDDAMALGGFRLKGDFFGLFDTVAVGTRNSFGDSWLGRLFSDHVRWAGSRVICARKTFFWSSSDTQLLPLAFLDRWARSRYRTFYGGVMKFMPFEWSRLRSVFGACILSAPLLAACGKSALPVAIHGVNYSVDPFSFELQDPNDPQNKGNGELVNPYAAGGATCCYELPKKWRPGIKVAIQSKHWIGKAADNSLHDVGTVHLIEIPRYADDKPGELWVLRAMDGTMDIVSSDFQPDHPKWPGKVKGWPVPSLTYQRERWNLYIDHQQSFIDAFKELQSRLSSSPNEAAQEEWIRYSEYDKKSLVGYDGPSDPKFRMKLRQRFSEGLDQTRKEIERLQKGRP
jgi:hypothetical protein